MTPMHERRMLQMAVAIACLVPFGAGLGGIVQGPEFVKGVSDPIPTDLDSHFRYLSGLLFGLGLGFAACIPRIETRGLLFRGLAVAVAVGGLARFLSLLGVGAPSGGHLFGLAMELGIVPLLALWQARLAKRFAAAGR